MNINIQSISTLALVIAFTFISCKETGNTDYIAFANPPAQPAGASLQPITENIIERNISQEFKDYWYAGTAEISSYKLAQARYGEMRDGNAVLIFVTEDFLPKKQVKADRQDDKNIPILKLNATKKFNTGIYPYSVMTSTFYPVFQEQHALKVTSSMQEWCGHVYAQLNNRKSFDIKSHSYFESQGDKEFSLEKDILENELWAQLRIDPSMLPTGSIHVIPDFSYTRMKHVPVKAYKALGILKESSYTLEYPTLNRTVVLHFSPQFPYTITSWEETYKDGYGPNAQELTTRATLLKTIKSPYWGKNSNKDETLREELGLE